MQPCLAPDMDKNPDIAKYRILSDATETSFTHARFGTVFAPTQTYTKEVGR